MSTQKLLKENGSRYMLNRKTEDGKYEICPYGGGFCYVIGEDVFKRDFKIVDEFPNEAKDDCAYLDGFISKDECIPCKADRRDRWNGWAKPYFSDDHIIEVARRFNLEPVKQKSDQIIFDDKNDPESSPVIAHKGKFGWGLGVGSWIWSLKSDLK